MIKISMVKEGEFTDKMKTERKIIAVVGLCGSGKSVVCDYIEEKGYKKVYFGGIVIEEVKKRGLDVIEDNEKKVREELRQKYGMEAMAILSIDKIKAFLKNNDNVLIDGLYSMSEYKVLKKEYPKMTTIAVFTPRELRYKRLSERKVRPLSREEAVRRDIAEIENIEKAGPIALADHTLINNDSIEKLKKQLEQALSNI